MIFVVVGSSVNLIGREPFEKRPIMKNKWYILLYHDISWEENSFARGIGGTIPPDLFRDHVNAISQVGKIVSIKDGLILMKQGTLTEPLFSFWFDDGFSGVTKYALPILQEQKVSAAVSICSKFVTHTDLFWRYKLAYLSSVDGVRFLRSKLRQLGYKSGMSVKNFCMNEFSKQIVDYIDELFSIHCSKALSNDAFRLFDPVDNILKLKKAGWEIANHTASHYPVGEDQGISLFHDEFAECQKVLETMLDVSSQYWVLPFDREQYRSDKLISTFTETSGNDQYLVLVGDKVNDQTDLSNRVINRFNVPIASSSELVRLLGKA